MRGIRDDCVCLLARPHTTTSPPPQPGGPAQCGSKCWNVGGNKKSGIKKEHQILVFDTHQYSNIYYHIVQAPQAGGEGKSLQAGVPTNIHSHPSGHAWHSTWVERVGCAGVACVDRRNGRRSPGIFQVCSIPGGLRVLVAWNIPDLFPPNGIFHVCSVPGRPQVE